MENDSQIDLVEYIGGEARPKKSHLWKLAENEHYVEEQWVDDRLFQEEPFKGSVIDPCCGFGRIVKAASNAGFHSLGTDIVVRGDTDHQLLNFLDIKLKDNAVRVDNIVMNPPFKQGREFVEQALAIASNKVAAIVPTRRLNAMGKWLKVTPLYRIWMLTPRPSMPPGSYITAGKKVGGGKQDFCWCVWLQGYEGKPTIEWLHRDGRKP